MMGKKRTRFDPRTVGKRIRELRLEKKLSQEELAELCDLSPSLIGHIERGEKGTSLSTAMTLCGIFNVTLDRLVFGRSEVVCDQSTCPLYMDLSRLMAQYDSKQSNIKNEA